ncbi:MAG TPA: thiamine pyrophosphate-binding protein, partial [Solirubrobacteraceae bacterium]|nr:thiamine pyrophosphate-binding protein [Solirubrobacteraceae bacterium]
MGEADQHVVLRAMVDELVRCGVRTAVTSPGSRSSPLVFALLGDGRLDCHSVIDERSSAFFALGSAKVTGMPAVVTSTSGTAAANHLPAVVEAWEAGVPMIVLTADRPPELREVGAGQAIDQIKLYGRFAKWFFELGTHAATPERLRWARTLACRLVWTALDDRPGPVHLNVALREPLVPPRELPPDASGRSGGRPRVLRTSGTAVANLAPAVIEAFQARVPLVVLTADRPPELREVGAGQTIDQLELYGSAAKWFFEVGTHDATPASGRWMRALACRALWTALDGRPGPVHLNFALREPLVPPAALGDDPQPGRDRGRPWVLRSTPG